MFATAPQILVEASPTDKYWGVGLDANNPRIDDKANWNGENKFGFLLTNLRDEMLASEKPQSTLSISRSASESETDLAQMSRKRNSQSTTPPSIPNKQNKTKQPK
jgi:hypothetical protein